MPDEIFGITGLDVMPRPDLAKAVWDKRSSAWAPGDDDPAERLGWLELPTSMRSEVPRLSELGKDLAGHGIGHVVLLGMGGSSLAPEVFFESLAPAPGYPELVVLDATHPDQIEAVTEEIDLESTIWIVSSKSGGTIETLSLYRYFRALHDDGSRFVAVTDPGTSLEKLARDEGFLDVFLNPTDIGGRYSALSLFGLVPAVLCGIDPAPLLDAAGDAARQCGREVPPHENPGLMIGQAMGEAALGGRNKLTFITSPGVASLGPWLEQLIAESTGKNDTGIVPIADEPRVVASSYGSDRLFSWIHLEGEDEDAEFVHGLQAAGHPVIETRLRATEDIAAEMFRWEFATAVSGAVLGINAFDQPNVEAAKKASRRILDSSEEIEWADEDPETFFAGLAPDELGVIVAFARRDQDKDEVLQAGRAKLLEAGRAATMRGFGPRYLHSTGQLHKGGPPEIRVLIALDEPETDAVIPGQDFGFAALVTAQAVGDAQALADAGRRVARTTWATLVEWASS